MTGVQLDSGEERMIKSKMKYEQKLLDKALADKDEVMTAKHQKNINYYDKKLKKVQKIKSEK